MYKYASLIREIIDVVMSDQTDVRITEFFASKGIQITEDYRENVLEPAIEFYAENCDDTYECEYRVDFIDSYGEPDEFSTDVDVPVNRGIRVCDDVVSFDKDSIDETFNERVQEEEGRREYYEDLAYESAKEMAYEF